MNDTFECDGYECVAPSSIGVGCVADVRQVVDIVRVRTTVFEELPLPFQALVNRCFMKVSCSIGFVWTVPQRIPDDVSQQVAHSERDLKGLSPDFCVLEYKWGLTSMIEDRFGYYNPDEFSRMIVVGCRLNCHLIAAAETAGIRRHHDGPCCRNKLGGIGQGTTHGQPPFHLYLVYG